MPEIPAPTIRTSKSVFDRAPVICGVGVVMRAFLGAASRLMVAVVRSESKDFGTYATEHVALGRRDGADVLRRARRDGDGATRGAGPDGSRGRSLLRPGPADDDAPLATRSGRGAVPGRDRELRAERGECERSGDHGRHVLAILRRLR